MVPGAVFMRVCAVNSVMVRRLYTPIYVPLRRPTNVLLTLDVSQAAIFQSPCCVLPCLAADSLGALELQVSDRDTCVDVGLIQLARN